MVTQYFGVDGTFLFETEHQYISYMPRIGERVVFVQGDKEVVGVVKDVLWNPVKRIARVVLEF